MSKKVLKLANQARGAFAGGAILENKPIGFPQDGGTQKPYSNLFYWANAWSDNGGLIGEHPHKMFEIMSFVIEGEIQHYDSKFDRWLSLSEGDAQIIRSGKGITHAEKIMGGGRMFQVWFDPDIQKTMQHEATYNDYKSADMSYYQENGIEIKNYIGNGGPIKMEAEGVEINELKVPKGTHQFKINKDKVHSYYLLAGDAALGNDQLTEHDFIIIEGEEELSLVVNSDARLFVISTPQKLSYPTYTELVNRNN